MKVIAELAFLVAAGGFLLLAILALARRRRLPASTIFVLAGLATALWLVVQNLYLADLLQSGLWMLTTEALRDLGWLALLSDLLPASRRRPVLLRVLAWVAVPAGLGLLMAGLMGFSVGVFTMVFFLLLSVALLMFSEQLYRASDTEGRWAVKFLCIGTGMMAVHDLYFYSQGLLIHSLDIEILRARGLLHLFLLPFVGVSLFRLAAMGERPSLALSGSGATFGLTLVATGVYLLAVAAGGYFVQAMGGQWSRYWEIVFLFLALLFLAAVLVSGRFRAWVRVMSRKHLLPYRYDYREEWRRLLHVLHSPDVAGAMPERGIAAVANLVESPAGVFWAFEPRQGVFQPIAGWGRPLGGSARIPADLPELRPLFERQWVIETDRENAAGLGRQLMLRDPWLLVPVSFEDEVLGFIELAQPRSRHDLDWEDYDLLRLAGMEVGAAYVQYRDAQRLAEASQFDAYHKTAAFVLHDIKNIVQQQSLLLKNAARHRDNPEFIDLSLRTIENSVQRMNALIARMRQGEEELRATLVDPLPLLEKAIERCSDRRPVPRLDAAEGFRIQVDPERFSSVVEHLVRNAQEATPEDGEVRVCMRSTGKWFEVEIRDTGVGMTPEFIRESYFKPFESRKKRAGMGIGAYQAREFARKSGGDLLVESTPGQGTRVCLVLPLAEGGEHAQ